MYIYETTIKMRDVDAAGVLFFARYLALAHDAFEAFSEVLGIGTARLMREGRYLLPVVKAEARYKRPLEVGEAVRIEVRVYAVNRRLAALRYDILGGDGVLACTVRLTYAALDPAARKAVPLPAEVRAGFEAHLEEEAAE